MQGLILLFNRLFGTDPVKTEPISKAGSNREYVRLFCADGQTVIGVIGQSVAENNCFIYLSKHFGEKGLPVPAILSVSDDCLCYLQEDLGTRALYDSLKAGRQAGDYSTEERHLIRQAIRLLPHIQVKGAKELDTNQLIQPQTFSPMAAMFDLNYFKYCFFKTTELPYNEVLLESDFQHLSHDLCATDCQTFLFRDFQARNIMMKSDGQLCVIDYQGGMLGPLHYDVASFLWQASACYSKELRQEMVEEYLDELSKLQEVNKEEFKAKLQLFVFFRLLQVLGAYGMRGYFERKKYFINSIPPAIKSLQSLLDDGVAEAYPYLESLLKEMVRLPKLSASSETFGTKSTSKYDNQGDLVVSIYSFSYKKGIPEDTSGNGGGYVFDCRSTHNPGRYEQYKPLTGLDQPVIDFLEDDGEIVSFLEAAYRLAERHVERFIERGFTHVMFSFGCTGGRHRSVYSAQHLAEHLHQKYGIEIHLYHREQNIQQTFAKA